MQDQDETRSCAACRFAVGEVPRGTITKVLFCRKNPPISLLQMTPKGLMAGVGFPPVNEKFWCFQFEIEAPKLHT